MKVSKVLLATMVTLAGVSLSVGVVAASSIKNTGPGSTNHITTKTSNTSTTNCNNNVTVSGSNLQNAGSGSSSASGNTSGGSAKSGSASNSNSSSINVNTNCASLTSSSSSPTPAGGKGGSPSQSPATSAANPVSVAGTLPETGSNMATELAIGSVVVLGGALLASRLGLAAYRRLSL